MFCYWHRSGGESMTTEEAAGEHRAAMGETLLEVEGLKQYFPVMSKGIIPRHVADIKAVDDVSFNVNRGETFGLVGESGCGKTTTGRAVMRLYEPTAGTVTLDGVNLSDLDNKGMRDIRRRMAMIFQDPYGSLDPRMKCGDIIGEPMLAHKATHEGKIAAEVIAGRKVEFQAMTIPSVAYTDPEIAWAGITEEEAKAQNLNIEKAVFPWAASGRAISTNRTEGMTKLIFNKKTDRLIGAAIVGTNAGELIAETVLGIEMGADAHDIGLSIHPHPTLSESVAMASEIKEGTITDLYIKKR